MAERFHTTTCTTCKKVIQKIWDGKTYQLVEEHMEFFFPMRGGKELGITEGGTKLTGYFAKPGESLNGYRRVFRKHVCGGK